MTRQSFSVGFFLFCWNLHASVLPRVLSPQNIDDLVQTFAFPSATRILRSAEPYELFPGLRIGLEVVLVSSGQVPSMGAGGAGFPSTIPIPRLQLVKGVIEGLEFGFSIAPLQLDGSLGTYGGTLKWAVKDEQEDWFALATYIGLTQATGFRDAYRSTTFEWGIIASRDFVRLKPFVGLGVMTATGAVAPIYARASNLSGRRWAVHSFGGLEVELPVNLSAQLDLFNLKLGGSFAVSAKF